MVGWSSNILINTPDFLKNEGNLEPEVFSDSGAAIRRYEQLLETHKVRHPFLLVRLASAYTSVGARGVAVQMCQEASGHLVKMGVYDDVLADYIESQNRILSAEAMENALFDMSGSLKFFQKWHPSANYKLPLNLAFPAGHNDVRDEWQALFARGTELFEAYIRSLAIETNHLESTFLITDGSSLDLVRRGISEGVVEAIPSSVIRSAATIKSILNDTLAAYDLLSDIDTADGITPQHVCDVHRCMMRTAGFLTLPIVPCGYSRAVTKKTVAINTSKGLIQCCPYMQVEQELQRICESTIPLIRISTFNPFAAASWIHFVFARCHPFNDGNGRTTRLISSIPLIRAGYPPISVSVSQRGDYLEAINAAYNRNFQPLSQCIYEGMRDTISKVKKTVSLSTPDHSDD